MNSYKFTPLIVEKDKNDKLLIDEEKLKELLIEAYNNGYMDGRAAYIPNSVPLSPTVPSPYWYDKFHCVS